MCTESFNIIEHYYNAPVWSGLNLFEKRAEIIRRSSAMPYIICSPHSLYSTQDSTRQPCSLRGRAHKAKSQNKKRRRAGQILLSFSKPEGAEFSSGMTNPASGRAEGGGSGEFSERKLKDVAAAEIKFRN